MDENVGKGPDQVENAERQSRPKLNASEGVAHDFGLAELIGLARVLGRMPTRLRVYGIEGRRFGIGSELSPEVAQAVEDVSVRIAEEARVAREISRLAPAGEPR